MAKREGSLITGCISSCRPEEDGFAAFLVRQQANPRIKGFRRVLVMPDNLSESELFRENIKRLEGTGLTFDLCVLPSQIDKAIALIDLAPSVQFILDHCGVPDIKGEGLNEWRGKIADIAGRPNVVAKISGVVAYADAEHVALKRSNPMCIMSRRVSAGTASSGAATGRFARLAAASPLGLPQPTRCCRAVVKRRRQSCFQAMQNGFGASDQSVPACRGRQFLMSR